MASQLDRWEKDPFFSAAEEVQESADRMESTYRTWIHAMKDDSSSWNSDELRRDLQTALGTTKWQLEEFERAVRLSYTKSLLDDAKDRHDEFIIAIKSQISKVESSLHKSAISAGKPPLPWVRLDEGESNELALFLSGSTTAASASRERKSAKVHAQDQIPLKPLAADKEFGPKCLKDSSDSMEWGQVDLSTQEKVHSHRRTASASADIGILKISVDDDVSLQNSQPGPPPRKIPSFSGFLNTMESASKLNLKWPKNGYRKLKLPDRQQDVDTTLSQPQNLPKGINTCYERCKSCLDNCDDCDKQLYGWYGAVQRQLQRSQYHMQYSRPIQFVFWIVLFLCLIVLVALRTI